MNKELRFIYRYLKYFILSKTKYGIHSPFVYKFVSDVIYDQTEYSEYEKVNQIRKALLSNNNIIVIDDLGAGSRVSNTRKKTISKICRHSTLKKKYSELLFRVVKNFKPHNILELGTSLGLSTTYFSIANPSSKVFTIEGSEEIFKAANENFKKHGLENINSFKGSFNENLDYILSNLYSLDFVFFDGDHTYESTINYFEKCLVKSNSKSIFVFDDINWSKEMEQAWSYIKNKEEVSVTIDIFFMGFVFFDNSLSKQHFVVRF